MTTGRYKRSFRNYLIDSKFQLKYTAILCLVALLVSAFLVLFLWKTSREVVAESRKVAEQSRTVVEQGQHVITGSKQVVEQTKEAIVANKKLSDVVRMGIEKNYESDPELLKAYTEATEKSDKEYADQQDAVVMQEQALVPQQQAIIDQANALVPQQENVARQQSTMLYVLIAALAVMVVLIGLFGIYVTHKVAGPIFKMKRLLRQVAEGKLVFDGRLRKGDELQDFFEAFTVMVEGLRARQAKEIDELERAIEIARKSGASAESIHKVSLVRDEMKRALEA